MDSGAGCPIGYQPYFEGVVLIDPSCHVQTYSCIDGDYTPIHMTGIISDAGGPPTSTKLPVAIEIKTPYYGQDGRPIHLMIALGMSVAVNFVLPNGWLKTIGALLDYGKKEIRLPFTTADDDITSFPMIFQRPKRSVPPTTLGTSRHQAAFNALPKVEGLVAIMKKYNPKSVWMGYACDYVQCLRFAASSHPTAPMELLPDDGAAGDANGTRAPAPSPPADAGAQLGGVRFKNPPVDEERRGDGKGVPVAAPDDESTISRGINDFLRGETAADAHGHAQSVRRSKDDDGGDLFDEYAGDL